MTGMVFFMLAGILVLAGCVLWLMFRFHHSQGQLNVEKYRRKWLEIEQLPGRDNQQGCHYAIIEADKLLDIAMREKGVRGDTMGERLKTAKDVWSDRNAVWTAHKLRNQLVHEADVKVDYNNTRRALADFKRALKDMGAI